MAPHARPIGLAVAVLSLAGFAVAPVAPAAASAHGAARSVAGARDPDPAALTVRSHCIGGGRVKVTVRARTGAGSYPVELTVRNVPNGSRWSGSVGAATSGGGAADHVRFHDVVAGHRTWTVTASLDARRATIFDVSAESAGRRECTASVFTNAAIQAGLALCRPRLVAAVGLLTRPDGDLDVRLFALPFHSRPAGRWTIAFRVSHAGQRQEVTIRRNVGPEQAVRGRAVLHGFDDPRVLVTATDPTGRPCAIGLNAAEVTSQRPLTLHQARIAARRLFARR